MNVFNRAPFVQSRDATSDVDFTARAGLPRLHAVHMPLALRYIENTVKHAVCRAVSCCVYVAKRIRIL